MDFTDNRASTQYKARHHGRNALSNARNTSRMLKEARAHRDHINDHLKNMSINSFKPRDEKYNSMRNSMMDSDSMTQAESQQLSYSIRQNFDS
jgi:hypothetical protein